jgi:hypothetical protein
MALEVADRTSGRYRVPIVPVGLAYTNPSAAVFRGSALVDIGKPIHVTDELLQLCDELNQCLCIVHCGCVNPWLHCGMDGHIATTVNAACLQRVSI